jgi:DNA repair exonuclease SbcCD ATPase subunit
MATEKKSIEISYKANIQQLKAQIQSIPGITDKEAKKMVAALDRQLKQAEKAAKQAAKAAKKGSADFKKLGSDAQKAGDKMEHASDTAGGLDRGFSAIGLALREVNPALAEAADGLADVSAVGEMVSDTIMQLNPAVIAGGAAVAALTLAYVAYTDSLEKARQLTLDLRDAQRSLQDAQKASQENFEDAASTYADLRERLQLLTGQITEYEYATIQAQRAAFEGIQDNIKVQEKLLKDKQLEMQMVEALRNAYIDQTKPAVVLSEEQKNQLKNLQLLTEGADKNLDLTDRSKRSNQALNVIYKSIKNEIGEIDNGLKGLVKMQDASVELAGQIAEFEHEQALDVERQENAAENRAKAQEDSREEAERLAKALQDAMNADLQGFHNRQKYNKELDSAREQLHKEEVKLLGTEEEQINFKYDNEIKRLKELAEKAQDKSKLNQMIAKAEEDRNKEQHEAQMARIEEEISKREEGFRLLFSNISAATDALQDMAVNQAEQDTARMERELAIQHEQEKGEVNRIENAADRKDAIKLLEEQQEAERRELEEKRAQAEARAAAKYFGIQKAVSIAEATMATAKGIINALATYPGPVGIALSSLMGATGAAQIGAIMSQQPSFHMGGLASDEGTARILKGEAVLDRATVRRIGGEDGVKQLQQGKQSQNNVMVVQPFKHFGRFAREIGFKQPKQTGMRGY